MEATAKGPFRRASGDRIGAYIIAGLLGLFGVIALVASAGHVGPVLLGLVLIALGVGAAGRSRQIGVRIDGDVVTVVKLRTHRVPLDEASFEVVDRRGQNGYISVVALCRTGRRPVVLGMIAPEGMSFWSASRMMNAGSSVPAERLRDELTAEVTARRHHRKTTEDHWDRRARCDA